MNKYEIKEKIAKAFKYDANTQLHINVAVWINAAVIPIWMVFGTKAAFWFLVAAIVLLVVWEIIYWKGDLVDSFRDLFFAGLVLSPILYAVINFKINMIWKINL